MIPYFEVIGIQVQSVISALGYFTIMLISFSIFWFLQTKSTISLQRNMYLLVSVETFCRAAQCVISSLENVAFEEIPKFSQQNRLRYIQEVVDMLSFSGGFAMYLSLIAFWAENSILLCFHYSKREKAFSMKSRIRFVILIILWVMIGVCVFIGSILCLVCCILDVSVKDFYYELGRMLYRVTSNMISISLLLFFSVFLCGTYHCKAIPGVGLTRITAFTLYVTFALFVFVIYNILRLVLHDIYDEWSFRWIIFLFLSFVDMSTSISILLFLRPRNCCTCNFREIDLVMEHVLEENVFDDVLGSNQDDYFYYGRTRRSLKVADGLSKKRRRRRYKEQDDEEEMDNDNDVEEILLIDS